MDLRTSPTATKLASWRTLIPPLPATWKLTADPILSAPNEPEDIVVDFEKGMPVKLTSQSEKEATGPTGIFLTANALARKHGVGRIDIVENRFIGLKSLGCIPALPFSTMHTSVWKADPGPRSPRLMGPIHYGQLF
jgi:argininosuccinate synthase